MYPFSPSRHGPWLILVSLLVILAVLLACVRTGPATAPWSVSGEALPLKPEAATYTPAPRSTRASGEVIPTPTPDQPRVLPTLRSDPIDYVVQSGDTLNNIARRYHVGLESLIQVNELPNPNLLRVGQVITIPVPVPGPPGSAFKVIPDSELVYGPMSAGFNLHEFVVWQGGYLATYSQEVEGQTLGGAQVIERVAQEFSVNPRLLLAVLEYLSGWVTLADPHPETLELPIVRAESWRKGLYQQLAYAANNLNRGYYLWRVNGIGAWLLADGSLVPIDPSINAGTAGIQQFFALLFERAEWDAAVSETGLLAVYNDLFGYPFDWAVEPLLPIGLFQPRMQLPFESGIAWAFTGGPHGGWGDGSAWAALDFAPPGEARGCVTSDEWVVAVSDGPVVRTGNGAVLQDLDLPGNPADSLEQTGWVVLYMHIESRDRVEPGAYLRAGDRIGHPSCEGGISTGTHVHLARKYNGEWIPADQTLPFVLDGWVSRGSSREYDGFLQRDDQSIEAWEGYFPFNQIQR